MHNVQRVEAENNGLDSCLNELGCQVLQAGLTHPYLKAVPKYYEAKVETEHKASQPSGWFLGSF